MFSPLHLTVCHFGALDVQFQGASMSGQLGLSFMHRLTMVQVFPMSDLGGLELRDSARLWLWLLKLQKAII